MDVKQIYSLMNTVTGEVLGATNLVQEDLSNVVDLGTQIFNQNAVDRYVQSLVNHIGKVVFVNRPYAGKVPSVILDAWEFGSVLQKVEAVLPNAVENESWELTDGETYSQDVFHKPTVHAKFFNSKVTFEVTVSITERQVKQSFSSVEQLNGFLSMIYNAVENSMTIKTDALVMRTINNFIGETIHADADAFKVENVVTYSSASTNRSVNLLKLYKDKYNESELTAENAVYDAHFIRFATYIMAMYEDRLSTISKVFNIGNRERFTPPTMLKTVLLSDFAKAARSFLFSDVENKEFVTLPKHETIPFWQGSGKDYDFSDVSCIKIKTASKKVVEIDGVIGVMFDRDALGVSNLDKRVTTNYNAKAEFYNNYYKFDAGYYNDTNENFIVFFVA